MFEITVKQDGKVIKDLSCNFMCMAYNDNGEINNVVCADKDTKVYDMSMLVCSVASAVEKSFKMFENNN